MSSMGSSDLPAILADTMNKSFASGYNEAASTFQLWCAEVSTPDFRAMSITKLSSFGDIDDLPEGANFKEGKFSDKKETISVSTKGKAITVSRQALINGESSFINDIPRAMGAAVRRRMNKDAYDLLTSNTLAGPTLTEDNSEVFTAAHGNLIENSGSPSVESIGSAEKALLDQQAPKGSPDQNTAYLNVPARFVVSGTSNRTKLQQLLGSIVDPAATDGKQVYNPYNGGLVPVIDAYLQSLLTAAGREHAFYLAADQRFLPTLTIAYLNGQNEPTIRLASSDVGEALGLKFDVFSDWGFAFQDYRGIVYSDGVTVG
jgi:hypothetical protein